MNKYPISSVCPKCGSAESRSRGGYLSSYQVCQRCQTSYLLPTPYWERGLVALAFILPGLVIGGAAVWVFAMMSAERQPVNPQGWWCCSVVGIRALLSVTQGIRELAKRQATTTPEDYKPEDFESTAEDERRRHSAEPSAWVPQAQAESIVRAIAEKHGAKGILRTLGNIRPEHLANAAARFAKEMTDEETPLALVDTSLLKNGKAGFLLTNRGLYSSWLRSPIWLSDIEEVVYRKPEASTILALYVLVALVCLCGPLGLLLLVCFQWSSSDQLKARLLVNGQKAYSGGMRLRAEFWMELLPALAAAARQTPTSSLGLIARAIPQLVVVETTVYRGGGQSDKIRRYPNAAWEQIEQSIRELDGETLPSLRIWKGQPPEGTALDVLGGKGKFVLREVGDGWIYYDPNQGDEEVEVCTSGQGYRCPAFYVCTDQEQVLKIARLFFERGRCEDRIKA